MSILAEPVGGVPAGTGAGSEGRDPAPVDAGDRGRLEVRRKAVERLVVHAAAEVDEVGGPVTRVLGQALGSADLDGRPRAAVTVTGDLVTVELSVSVVWPAPVVEVAQRLRSRVGERLSSLAAMRVGHVDVHVTALPPDRRQRRRVR
jgi:uncharacterized alkaline shock family protein YloU